MLLSCSNSHELSVENLKIQLELLQEIIRSMKSNKFWKLRKAWFQLKKVFGIKGDK
jgi:queuine/archaeosine tRNA-ribosyltransferase